MRELKLLDSELAHVCTFKPDGTIVTLDDAVIFDMMRSQK